MGCVSSGGAPTPAGTSVFIIKHLLIIRAQKTVKNYKIRFPVVLIKDLLLGD